MKGYYNIEQRTEAWFLKKWGKIGGTASSGLFQDSDTLFMNILSELTEDYTPEDGFQSSAMLRGQELEPEAKKQIEAYTGVTFNEVGWLQNLTRKLLGISPDGISEDETEACEIKCLGKVMHNTVIMGDTINKDHIHQCIHYFTVNPKLKKLHYCCFRPEHKFKPLFVKTITRDSLVDIGRKIKGKVNEDRGNGFKDYVCNLPDMKTVAEWVEIAEESADKLQIRLDAQIDKLQF